MLVDSCIIAESDHLAHVPAQDAHLFTEDHMNGRFLRCIAEPRAAHVKHLSRCKRTQHKITVTKLGPEAVHRCAVHEGPLWAESDYSNSTASLSCSEFTSIYLWVVEICECAANSANKRTPTPLLAKQVM